MNSKYVTERQRVIQCINMYIKLRSKTLRFLFHLLLLGRRSSRLFCFDVAAILECTSGLNEGVQPPPPPPSLSLSLSLFSSLSPLSLSLSLSLFLSLQYRVFLLRSLVFAQFKFFPWFVISTSCLLQMVFGNVSFSSVTSSILDFVFPRSFTSDILSSSPSSVLFFFLPSSASPKGLLQSSSPSTVG